MKQLSSILMVTLIFLIYGYSEVSATKWVELDPKEVIEGADVIVVGTYDMSADAEQDNMYAGFPFEISRVYKGEAVNPMIVGMDVYDTGLVKDFQDKGGEYLLFLEDGEADFLVPVAGPNGMIKLNSGKIVTMDGRNVEPYSEILNGDYKMPVDEASADNASAKDSGKWWWYFAGLGVLGVLFFIRIKRT